VNLTLASELANVLSAALTAYLALRTAYIWYRYLKFLRRPRTPGSLLENLRQALAENPPASFPTADLPIATILLALSSIATVILYVWLKFAPLPCPAA
jgi:hypothetical protein